MRVTRVLAILLLALSALSFGWTIYTILTTQWNTADSGDDWEWRNGNWWEDSGSIAIWSVQRYNWFFGYYNQGELGQPHSLLDVLNVQSTESGYYNPFPSALLGLYLLVCGAVFWFVKADSRRPSWFYSTRIRDNKFVTGTLSTIDGGVISLVLSALLVYDANLRNDTYQAMYFHWVFPLAFLGMLLLVLGIVGLCFVIIENRRLRALNLNLT